MVRVELVPLHLPIPELVAQARMARAEIQVMEVDLLQLSASVRVLQIEAAVMTEPEVQPEALETLPEDDESST